jgi:hypothetical protein
MLKKGKEKKSMPKGMSEKKMHAKEHEKNPMLKSMKKKKRKIAHTFKGNHQNDRESCSKEYKNI